MTGSDRDGEHPLLLAVRHPGDREWTPARGSLSSAGGLDLDRVALRPTGDGLAVALAPGDGGVTAVPFSVDAAGSPARVARSKVRHVGRFDLARSPICVVALPGPATKAPRFGLHDVAIREVDGSQLRLDPGRHQLAEGVGVLQIGAGDDPLPLLVELVACNPDGTVEVRLADPSAEVVTALAEQLVLLVLRGVARPITGA